jgi:hypothetical protein
MVPPLNLEAHVFSKSPRLSRTILNIIPDYKMVKIVAKLLSLGFAHLYFRLWLKYESALSNYSQARVYYLNINL